MKINGNNIANFSSQGVSGKRRASKADDSFEAKRPMQDKVEDASRVFFSHSFHSGDSYLLFQASVFSEIKDEISSGNKNFLIACIQKFPAEDVFQILEKADLNLREDKEFVAQVISRARPEDLFEIVELIGPSISKNKDLMTQVISRARPEDLFRIVELIGPSVLKSKDLMTQVISRARPEDLFEIVELVEVGFLVDKEFVALLISRVREQDMLKMANDNLWIWGERNDIVLMILDKIPEDDIPNLIWDDISVTCLSKLLKESGMEAEILCAVADVLEILYTTLEERLQMVAEIDWVDFFDLYRIEEICDPSKEGEVFRIIDEEIKSCLVKIKKSRALVNSFA